MKHRRHGQGPCVEVQTQAVVHCLVCAKRIRPADEVFEIHHTGTSHRVCCPSCVTKFKESPGTYTPTS